MPVANNEILIEEIKIIASAITDLDQKSAQIKQWALSIWVAVISLWATEPTTYRLIAVLLPVIPIIFILLDIQVKRNQRKFIWRSTDIFYWLNACENTPRVKSQFDLMLHDPSSAQTAAVNGRDSEYGQAYAKWIRAWNSLLSSKTLTYFYLGFFAASILVTMFILFCPR